MLITLPNRALVALVGVAGAGKTTFARRHFLPTETVSSDHCRALISDSENDMGATDDAFELLYSIVSKRLARRLFTVVDATHVSAFARRGVLQMARRHHLPAVAIVFDLPLELIAARNTNRPGRPIPVRTYEHMFHELQLHIHHLREEGFQEVYYLHSVEEIESAEVRRVPLPTDRADERGPFDIIGDVHGCCDELEELLVRLGYQVEPGQRAVHPEGRRLIFVGDIVDRGPRIADALRLVMNTVHEGTGFCVPGNHDFKMLKVLQGRSKSAKHGLALTLEELECEGPAFRHAVQRFVEHLPSHLLLDGGQLVVAHAGIKEEWHGRDSRAIRDFALFGDTTGEKDEYGLPIRLDWARHYRGHALVVYGHTPIMQPLFINNTINIDTGCVFGGSLTALRYPERELVSVPARRMYWEPARPIQQSMAAPRITGPDEPIEEGNTEA